MKFITVSVAALCATAALCQDVIAPIDNSAVPSVAAPLIAQNDANIESFGEVEVDTSLEGFFTEVIGGEEFAFLSEDALNEAELNELELIATEGEMMIEPIGTDLIGGWTDVEPSTVQSDATLKAALDFGVNTLVDQLVQNGTLPDEGVYTVTEIYEVRSQVVAGMNYQFQVQVYNEKSIYAELIFTVYDALDGTQSLNNDSSYTIYNA